MTHVKSSIVFLALCTAVPARSAEPVRVVSWEDCVREARDRNPELLAARRSLESARASYKGSYNGLFPSLTVSNSYSETDTSGGKGTWHADGRASVDVFNLRNNAEIALASASLKQSDASYRLVSADLRLALTTAFVDLLFVQNQVSVSEQIRDVRSRNASLVNLKYESGRESKGNMLQAKAELADAEARLSESLRNLSVAQYELSRRLGDDHFKAISASGTLTVPAVRAAPDISFVVESHPQVIARVAEKHRGQAALGAARASAWPTLSANYTRSFQGDTYFPGSPHWSASGVVSLPLFGNGPTSTFYAVSSAKRSLEQTEQNIRSTRNAVRTELESSWAALSTTIDQVAVQREFLEAARQRNNEALIRYSSGLMSFENWEIVVTDFVNFERSRLRAERDAAVAAAAWERALGKTLEEP